jgi:hypothetical protein
VIELLDGGLGSYSWSRPGLRHLARFEAVNDVWGEQVGVDKVEVEGDASWETVQAEGAAVSKDSRAGEGVKLEFALASAGECAAGTA